MKIITTDKAPAAIGPYSQAVEHNGIIYCSGQIGIDPQSGKLREGLQAQVEQILVNVSAVLAAAGTSKEHVIKTTIYLTSIADFQRVNEWYASFFEVHAPARSTVEVSALPKGALVEIEVIATL
ncbi:MAG: RidA family protein [Patescibacteria group bacterium]